MLELQRAAPLSPFVALGLARRPRSQVPKRRALCPRHRETPLKPYRSLIPRFFALAPLRSNVRASTRRQIMDRLRLASMSRRRAIAATAALCLMGLMPRRILAAVEASDAPLHPLAARLAAY